MKKHNLLNEKFSVENLDEEPNEKVDEEGRSQLSPISATEGSPKTKKEAASSSGSAAATGLLHKFRNLQITTKSLTALHVRSDVNGLGDIEEESEGYVGPDFDETPNKEGKLKKSKK